jgi:hypothetical protein
VAITIPILTTFNGRGIDRGIAQFRTLETKGQKAGFLIRKAALPAALALGAMGLAAKQGVQGVMEDDKALANLSSTLKSTGNAANITADGFFKYANELQSATGVGADQITQGAALLGTFKNIRNEVGKGNDIFNRTTVAAMDLSAKGFGSLESANKMLGKALNDPIKGITALSRAGVTFTEGQKKTIASLVASGKTLEAQKIILKEVESQVGGTSKAMGETTAGRLERGKRAFEELQKSLAKALLPAIEMFAGLLTKVSGFLQKNEGVVKVAAVALGGLAVAVLAVNAAFKVMSAVSLLASPLGIVLAAVGALAAGLIWLESKTGAVSATFKTLYSWLKTVWDFLSPIAASAFDGLKSAFTVVSTAGQKVWDVLKGLWGVVKPVVDFMKPIMGAAFNGLKTAFNVLFNPVEKVKTALAIIDPILNPIINALKAVGSAAFNGLKRAFEILAVPINAVATALGKVKDLWGWVTSNIQGTGNNPFAPGGPLAGAVGTRSMALTPMNLSGGATTRNAPIQINVQAGLVSTPDQVGQQIIEAIQRAQRRSGPAFVAA